MKANIKKTLFKGLKIFGAVAGFLCLLFVVLALSINFLVDLEQVRSQVLEQANKKINGSLELGKIHFSFWKGLRLRIDSVIVKNKAPFEGVEALNIKEAEVGLDFVPLFYGKIRSTLKLGTPQISVIRNSENKLNIAALFTLPEAKAEEPPKEEVKEAEEEGVKGIAQVLIKRLRIRLKVEEGSLKLIDELKKQDIHVENVHIVLNNVGLNKEVHFKISANIKPRRGGDVALAGNFSLQGRTALSMDEKMAIKSMSFSKVEGNFDQADMRFKDFFAKAKGVPLQFSATGSYDKTTEVMTLDKSNLKLGALNVDFSASISKDRIKAEGKTNRFSLGEVAKFLPKLDTESVKGTLNLEFNVDEKQYVLQNLPQRFGALEEGKKIPDLKPVNVSAKLEASEFEFKPKGAKTIHGKGLKVEIKPTLISVKEFEITSENTSVKGTLHIDNWSTAPKGRIEINASNFDLNDLIPPAEATQEPESVVPKVVPKKGKPAQEISSGKAPSPIVMRADVTGTISVKKAKVRNFECTDLGANLKLLRGVVSLKDLSLKSYKGKIFGEASYFLNRYPPYLSFRLNVENLDLNEALTQQQPTLKDTLFGKLNANLDFNGTGKSAMEMVERGMGSGSILVKETKFTTLNLTKTITDAIRIIPGLKVVLPEVEEDMFDKLETNLEMRHGQIHTPNLNLYSKKNHVSASGYFDTKTNLNYNGTYYLTAEKDPLMAIPFLVVGTFKTPVVLPDVKTFAQRVAGSILKEATEPGDIVKGAEKVGEKILKGIEGILLPSEPQQEESPDQP